MQARKEHIDAHEGEGRDQQADHRPPGQHRAPQSFGQANVQPGSVVEPHDEGPGFFRIPLPISAPGFGCP